MQENMAKQQQLDWDDFRLVKIIAEANGLAGAAERLGVNHSTVFRRLGQMEENLGVKLFERHRTGYVLTPAGEEMLDYLRDQGCDQAQGYYFSKPLPAQALEIWYRDTYSTGSLLH